MCDRCGCGDPKIVSVDAHESLLAENDHTAEHLREHFRDHGVLAINVMGSPGSGKTALLEATGRASLARGWTIAAVSGDLATDNDAVRLRRAGVDAEAINTVSACHLDAEMVHDTLHAFGEMPDVFFIENVGNLVCPAVYDLGQAANVVVLSVTEGDDKPLKYPVMFRKADLVILSKTDLAPYVDARIDVLRENIARVMPCPLVFEISAKSGEGIETWMGWLDDLRAAMTDQRRGENAR